MRFVSMHRDHRYGPNMKGVQMLHKLSRLYIKIEYKCSPPSCQNNCAPSYLYNQEPKKVHLIRLIHKVL